MSAWGERGTGNKTRIQSRCSCFPESVQVKKWDSVCSQRSKRSKSTSAPGIDKIVHWGPLPFLKLYVFYELLKYGKQHLWDVWSDHKQNPSWDFRIKFPLGRTKCPEASPTVEACLLLSQAQVEVRLRIWSGLYGSSEVEQAFFYNFKCYKFSLINRKIMTSPNNSVKI